MAISFIWVIEPIILDFSLEFEWRNKRQDLQSEFGLKTGIWRNKRVGRASCIADVSADALFRPEGLNRDPGWQVQLVVLAFVELCYREPGFHFISFFSTPTAP